MNLLAFALAAAIVIASTSAVITQMGGIFAASQEQNDLDAALNSLKRLDNEMRGLEAKAGDSQSIVRFSAGGGMLRIYDDTDVVEYYVNRGFGTQSFTEGNINFIYGSGNTTLRINYAGSIDIAGNMSRSGNFRVSVKRNADNIQIEAV